MAAPAAAQPPQARGDDDRDESSLFFETVEVNVVNVEVFVIDKDGNRVTGLGRDDFEIYEDGRPVQITNFYAVQAGRPVVALPEPLPVAGGPAAIEPLPEPEPQEAELPEDQRLHLIIYVDNLNIRPANRRWVLTALQRFLYEHVDRDDLVMLASYDRDLHLRHLFTRDPAAIAGALDEVGKLTAGAVARDSDRQRALQEIEQAPSVSSAVLSAKGHAAVVYNETRLAIAALKDLITMLSGVRGRKALLYVSDGVPLIAAEDLFVAVEEKFRKENFNAGRTQIAFYDLARSYQDLAAHANSSGVTLYTLDSKGLQVDSSVSAEYAGSDLFRGLTLIDSTRNQNLLVPLEMMAEITGGQAIVGTNALDPALAKVAQDFDTYYSLGYQPAHAGDGRYHKIEVKVAGLKGVMVRHREGYRDKGSDARMVEGSLATLHFGFERNPLEARIEFEPATRAEGGNYLLPVLVKIPISSITLAPREGFHHGRIRLTIGVVDQEGDVSPVQQQPAVDITIPDAQVEEARRSYYSYALSLLVRPGSQRIAVGVRDEFSNEISYVIEGVRVGG